MSEDLAQATYYRDDEIDLFELAEGLWARKWLIAGITGAITAIGLIAALLISPTYQASTQVRAPDLSDLTAINETGILEITPEEAFGRGLDELASQGTRMRTFEALRASDQAPEFPAEAEWNWRRLAEGISVTRDKSSNFASVSFNHGDPEFASAVVNQLITEANHHAAMVLVDELESSLTARTSLLQQRIKQEAELEARAVEDRITQLLEYDKLRILQVKDQISILRSKNEQLREDRIAQLEEAREIAESLGITESRFTAQLSSGSGGNLAIRADLEGEGDPLYLRGTKMLSAEITALKARKTDDFSSPEIRELEAELVKLQQNREVEVLRAREDNSAFVEGIRELRTELNQIQGFMDQDYSNIRLLKLDEPAVPPEAPIKPRKSLIVAASLVAGGMLAILIALIMNAADQRRRAKSGAA